MIVVQTLFRHTPSSSKDTHLHVDSLSKKALVRTESVEEVNTIHPNISLFSLNKRT